MAGLVTPKLKLKITKELSMAKSKKAAATENTQLTKDKVEEVSNAEVSGPSVTELVEKMKKEGKSYIRLKKLF